MSLAPRARERLAPHGIPVDGVVHVLAQVGARLAGESVARAARRRPRSRGLLASSGRSSLPDRGATCPPLHSPHARRRPASRPRPLAAAPPSLGALGRGGARRRASPRRAPSRACSRRRARCWASDTTRRTRRCACACSAFGKELAEEGLLEARIADAVARRAASPLLRDTDAVRLVNAEGDGLPGLVADRYGGRRGREAHERGHARAARAVAAALRAATGAAVGFERADSVAARKEGLPARQGPLWGEPPAGAASGSASAAGATASISPRDRRPASTSISATRAISSSGWPPAAACSICSATRAASRVAAARGGAQRAHARRFLRPPRSRSRGRISRRTRRAAPARLEQADAFEFLRADDAGYDLLILDPPPMARARARRRPRGARLQGSAAQRAAALGAARLLLVFACSHHIGAEKLRQIVFGASLEAGRSLRVLATLGARARSRRRARPSGGRLPLRPAARGVSGIAERARARRALRRERSATRRRAGARRCSVGAEPPASADAALASWAERAGVFRGAGGVDPLAALPRARRARGSARARPRRSALRIAEALARAQARGRLLRRRRRATRRSACSRRAGSRAGSRSLRSVRQSLLDAAADYLAARFTPDRVGGFAWRPLAAYARLLRERRARAARRGACSGAAASSSAASGRGASTPCRRRGSCSTAAPASMPGREARAQRARARAAGEQAADGSWPLLGRRGSRRARAARPRRAHRAGAARLSLVERALLWQVRDGSRTGSFLGEHRDVQSGRDPRSDRRGDPGTRVPGLPRAPAHVGAGHGSHAAARRRAAPARGSAARANARELRNWESGQSHVALYLYNGNEYLEGMLGAFKARCVPFNVNYRYVEEELEYLFDNADARADRLPRELRADARAHPRAGCRA